MIDRDWLPPVLKAYRERVVELRDGCQVWWAAVADVRPWHADLLDPVERVRRERYVRSADRDRFTLGVAMTRLLLAGVLGVPPAQVRLDRRCDECGRPHGPPRPAAGSSTESGPYLSISHSGDRIVLALTAAGPVGVDVEADSGRIGHDISGHLLSAAEAATLQEQAAVRSGSAELLSYWTRKEAIVKATGEGLRVPLQELTVSAPGEPPRLLAWAGRPGFEERVALHTLHPGPGYSACLALLDQPPGPVTEISAAELLTAPGRWAGERPREKPSHIVEP